MKILIIHNRYRSQSPSGENRVVDQESAALEAAGHDVIRFERSSDEIDTFPARRKARVPLEIAWSPSSAREVAAVLADVRPDVAHAHNLFPLLSPATLAACRSARVPVVVTIHNYRLVCPNGELFRSGHICHDCVGHVPAAAVHHGCYRGSRIATLPLAVATLAQRSAWRRLPSAYVFISRSQRSEHSSMDFPESRCFVKPNIVPPVRRKEVGEDLIVYAGRLSESKGLRLLMKAWDRFQTTCPGSRLRLAIAGSGPLDREVSRWSDQQPTVDMLGLLSRTQCQDVVSRARAVVVPSEWLETFGLVVVEAMAAGVVPIVPAHGSFPELLLDGVDGVLFPPHDHEALAAIFDRAARHPDAFEAMGIRAFQAYKARFDPEANIRQLEAIYGFAMAHPAWIAAGDIAAGQVVSAD